MSIYDSLDADVLHGYHEFNLASLLYYAMKESSCSELSARMTAMDGASKNAGMCSSRAIAMKHADLLPQLFSPVCCCTNTVVSYHRSVKCHLSGDSTATPLYVNTSVTHCHVIVQFVMCHHHVTPLTHVCLSCCSQAR